MRSYKSLSLLALLLTSPAFIATSFAEEIQKTDMNGMDHSMHSSSHMGSMQENSIPADTVTKPEAPAGIDAVNLPPPSSVGPLENIIGQPSDVPAPSDAHSRHTSSSHDMILLDPKALPQAAPDRMGGEVLPSEIIDGKRTFKLSASMIGWPITHNVTVAAMAYNGQVTGPTLRAKQGETVRIIFTNNLPEPTTVHWHGLDVPIEMDGVPDISQPVIKTGESFTYEFKITNSAGTYFYHTHVMPDRQMALGLAGAFIVEPMTPPRTQEWTAEYPIVLNEWTVKNGGNLPSMPMEGMMPNYFTLNGKAWPDTQKIEARVGDKILFRIINAGSFSHPIHLHGAPFKVIATDGHPIPVAAQLTKDTLEIAPGERYDILWSPTREGTWLLHCHINHHTMNDGQEDQGGMGGMTMAIEVSTK